MHDLFPDGPIPIHSYTRAQAIADGTLGRAHDFLWMARLAARAYRGGTDAFPFTVRIGRRNVRLFIHIGPGDHGERVATIMLPGEN